MNKKMNIMNHIFDSPFRFFYLFLLILATSITISCDEKKIGVESPPIVEPPVVDPKPKEELKPITDMVLLYGGGTHRNVTWNKQYLKPYVTYTDDENTEHWLFDGFLFLEFVTGNPQLSTSRIFAFGYGSLPARKQEWQALADYYFTPNNAVYALEDAIADAATRIGVPPKKVRVVICVPQPIPTGAGSRYPQVPTDYWGDINGKKIDLSKKEDRLEACTWYVDYVSRLFSDGKFKHVELAGFYWIAESIDETSNMLPELSDILNRRKFSLNWIPCWKTVPIPDFFSWKNYKFTYAYLQPNYFFYDVPLRRLTEACEHADKYDLDLEFEFDHNVRVASGRTKVSRMYAYMEAFRKNNMLATKKIAYYQGSDVLAQMYFSKNAPDRELYNEFCEFILEHQRLYGK